MNFIFFHYNVLVQSWQDFPEIALPEIWYETYPILLRLTYFYLPTFLTISMYNLGLSVGWFLSY